MITRRQLIASGMLVTGLGIAPFAVRPSRLQACVVDPRFEDARLIALHASTPATRLIELPRDVLALWHDELMPSIGSLQRELAGVTTERGFFLLRTLAADQRLRVRFQALHDTPRAGRIVHSLEGGAGQIAQCLRTPNPECWQAVVGTALGDHPGGRPLRRQFVTLAGSTARRNEPLVSWVISPAASPV